MKPGGAHDKARGAHQTKTLYLFRGLHQLLSAIVVTHCVVVLQTIVREFPRLENVQNDSKRVQGTRYVVETLPFFSELLRTLKYLNSKWKLDNENDSNINLYPRRYTS